MTTAPMAAMLLEILLVSARAAVGAPLDEPCAVREELPEHMRPMDCGLAAAVDSGLARSTTFRAMVDRIAALNGVVWIRPSFVVRPPLNTSVPGALVHRVTHLGPRRALFVLAAPGRGGETVMTLAHEFQHVIEVLESTASTEAEIDALFLRIGAEVGPWTQETARAVQMADIVRREMSASR